MIRRLARSSAGANVGGRRTEASERGAKHARAADAKAAALDDEERGAPQVELTPAGTPIQPATLTPEAAGAASSAPALAANATDAESELALVNGQPKMEGPALKYERGEGKAEIVKGKEQRRERRAERKQRAAEEAAAGILPEKRALENPKKNADRSQLEKKESKGGERPQPREKKDTPKEPEGG